MGFVIENKVSPQIQNTNFGFNMNNSTYFKNILKDKYVYLLRNYKRVCALIENVCLFNADNKTEHVVHSYAAGKG